MFCICFLAKDIFFNSHDDVSLPKRVKKFSDTNIVDIANLLEIIEHLSFTEAISDLCFRGCLLNNNYKRSLKILRGSDLLAVPFKFTPRDMNGY